METPPFSVPYDLSRLSDAGAEVDVSASEEQRELVAKWAGIDKVGSLAAKVTLGRPAPNRFVYRANLEADITQSCVVTLAPVQSHLSLDISRSLHLSKAFPRAATSQDDLSTGSDEGPEEINSLHYDLAGPLLEEFALAIDPYPRAPGVVFEPPPAETDEAVNPFKVLKTLKRPG
ncbi:MAG: hypothetical protein JO056_05075 [Alphaproteobacteria bacterium]|nr:hypothetical protein [Alphaproteobacteria bacterium]